MNMSSDYDSDSEAPEDVAFSIGKADAIRNLEITKAERNKQDNSLKEWRRKRDAQYRQQKEKRLSLDVLMKADAEIKRRRKEGNSDLEESNIGDEDSSGENFDSDGSETEQDVLEHGQGNVDEDDTKDESLADKYEEDLSIAIIDSTRSRPLMQAALDFKARSLYGGRIKRMDMSQVRSRREKQKMTNKIRKEAIKARRLKRVK